MCGGNTSSQRLTATGLLNSLQKSEWIGIAEELATLPLKDFEKVIRAFCLYREAINLENSAEYHLPKRTAPSNRDANESKVRK